MTDCEKLECLISETDVLIDHAVTPSTPGFQAWFSEGERFLIKRFGQDSFEYKKFKETKFMPGAYVTDAEVIRKCKEGLTATKLIFKSYLSEMNEENASEIIKAQPNNYGKIFIVHGHNEELKQTVARLVEKQDIEAIILSEKANKGKTIIEKLEEHSDVGCAICLFTADDVGKANKETDYKTRARQNVVLEAGYFMGKLGRKHVIFIAVQDLEMPSDLQGVVYANANNWQFDLLKELKEMGYNIDFNKAL